MSDFDPELLQHLRSRFPDNPQAAVDEALTNARRLASGWKVALAGWLPGATGSLVLKGHRDNDEVVLRIPIDLENANRKAMVALSSYGGVNVLESDVESGATLMPLIVPGQTLATVGEDEAIVAVAEVIGRLRFANGEGASIADYVKPVVDERRLPDSLRPGLAKDLAQLACHLIETAPPSQFLHGDLHHFNVLRHGDGWVAIDPEGMSGDPAYEWAAFMRNPVPQLADDPLLVDRLHRRIIRFGELSGDPPERIWGWAIVRTAQSVSWSDSSPFHLPWTKVLAGLDELRSEFS